MNRCLLSRLCRAQKVKKKAITGNVFGNIITHVCGWKKKKNRISYLLTEKHTTYKTQKENLSLLIQPQTDGDYHSAATDCLQSRQTIQAGERLPMGWACHTRLAAMSKGSTTLGNSLQFLRSYLMPLPMSQQFPPQASPQEK